MAQTSDIHQLRNEYKAYYEPVAEMSRTYSIRRSQFIPFGRVSRQDMIATCISEYQHLKGRPRNSSQCVQRQSLTSLFETTATRIHVCNRGIFIFVCLICDVTSQSTTMVMSRQSVNLTTLFLGRLPKRLTSTKCTPFRQ